MTKAKNKKSSTVPFKCHMALIIVGAYFLRIRVFSVIEAKHSDTIKDFYFVLAILYKQV